MADGSQAVATIKVRSPEPERELHLAMSQAAHHLLVKCCGNQDCEDCYGTGGKFNHFWPKPHLL